jgi:hypothetical protein
VRSTIFRSGVAQARGRDYLGQRTPTPTAGSRTPVASGESTRRVRARVRSALRDPSSALIAGLLVVATSWDELTHPPNSSTGRTSSDFTGRSRPRWRWWLRPYPPARPAPARAEFTAMIRRPGPIPVRYKGPAVAVVYLEPEAFSALQSIARKDSFRAGCVRCCRPLRITAPSRGSLSCNSSWARWQAESHVAVHSGALHLRPSSDSCLVPVTLP